MPARPQIRHCSDGVTHPMVHGWPRRSELRQREIEDRGQRMTVLIAWGPFSVGSVRAEGGNRWAKKKQAAKRISTTTMPTGTAWTWNGRDGRLIVGKHRPDKRDAPEPD